MMRTHNIKRKIIVGVISTASFLLLACGSSEQPVSTSLASEDADDTAKTNTPANRSASPHNIQGMKKVMDDARAVEAVLQESLDRRQQEINKY